MSDCEHCGGLIGRAENTQRYHLICDPCAQSIAGDRLPHYSSRERADCTVCKAYRHEHAIPIDV